MKPLITDPWDEFRRAFSTGLRIEINTWETPDTMEFIAEVTSRYGTVVKKRYSTDALYLMSSPLQHVREDVFRAIDAYIGIIVECFDWSQYYEFPDYSLAAFNAGIITAEEARNHAGFDGHPT